MKKQRFTILWTFIIIMWAIASCNDMAIGMNIDPKKVQSDSCKCAKPIKNTVNWCTGNKGGQYCYNAKGEKRYKPKK